MKFELMSLPYEENALEPYISAETVSYHYGKHHAGYVNKLNALIEGTEFVGKSLEFIIKNSKDGIFNNAAQIYNHDFYWHGLSAESTAPSAELSNAIGRNFGSMQEFKKLFLDKAATLFGSGWAWLILNQDQKLSIEGLSNADNPLKYKKTALLTCDVWEHAYYIDYRNVRADYLENYWKLINWKFVSDNFANAEVDATSEHCEI